jgi:hypothetical protein
MFYISAMDKNILSEGNCLQSTYCLPNAVRPASICSDPEPTTVRVWALKNNKKAEEVGKAEDERRRKGEEKEKEEDKKKRR